MKESSRQRKSLLSYIMVTFIALFLVLLNSIGKNTFLSNFAAPPAQEVNCETYFDERNGYRSLSDLILEFNNDTLNYYDEVKTWGTVTKVYFNSNSTIKSFYIESTSREGKSAAMLIYNYRGNVDVTENNVLTVTGYVSSHNDRPQIVDPLVTIDYTENSSPVTPFIFTEEFLSDINPPAFVDRVGPIRIKMENVYLTGVSSTTATIKWPGGYYSATLFYNSLSTQDDIWSKLLDSYYDDEIISLYGFLDFYGGWPQVLLRDPSDIKTSTSGGDPEPDPDPTLLTLDLFDHSYPNIGRFATGNYGSSYVDGFDLSFYRLYRSSRYSDITFLPYISSTSDGTIGAAFFNDTPIKGITNFSITYRTNKLSGTAPTLYYGENKFRTEEVTLPLTTSYSTFNFPVEDVNYFNLVASDAALYVSEFNVTYSDTGIVADIDYLGSGDGLYRLNPETSPGVLYEGKEVTVPINVSTSSSGYTVLATKTYTYYSFDHIEANYYSFDDVSEFAYTDPVDLAAFFNAFKTYPANYVPIGSYNFSRAKDVFGSDARQVSHYDWTTGYATSVPWRGVPGKNYPSYFELDLDLDGEYYYGSRGVGRLVCWEYGFAAQDYDYSPVCVYTDDHYETFQEYLNTGHFGERFNSARNRTNYVWSAPITL